jgi:hypothetical protein
VSSGHSVVCCSCLSSRCSRPIIIRATNQASTSSFGFAPEGQLTNLTEFGNQSRHCRGRQHKHQLRRTRLGDRTPSATRVQRRVVETMGRAPTQCGRAPTTLHSVSTGTRVSATTALYSFIGARYSPSLQPTNQHAFGGLVSPPRGGPCLSVGCRAVGPFKRPPSSTLSEWR